MRYLALLDSDMPEHGLIAPLCTCDRAESADGLGDAVLLVAHPHHGGIAFGDSQHHRLMHVTLDSVLRAAHAARFDGAQGGSRPLSAREREVLALMADGLSNAEIAQAMSLSLSTVKFHVSSILAKLAVEGRVEAVARAIRDGLLPVNAI
jgi:DNA-binding CsgD family transcriptional regulator